MRVINQHGKYLIDEKHIESIIATHEYGMEYTYIDKTKVTIIRVGMVNDDPVMFVEIEGI